MPVKIHYLKCLFFEAPKWTTGLSQQRANSNFVLPFDGILAVAATAAHRVCSGLDGSLRPV